MEEINIQAVDKEGRYLELIPQIRSLIEDEPDSIANLANVSAAIKQSFDTVSWAGFYLLRQEMLVLGPFQGKIACTRIQPGKGVCGTSFSQNKTIIVPDVEKFPGHIYCDGDTKSEIVIPVRNGVIPIGVFDLDSYLLNCFDEVDQKYLEKIVLLLEQNLHKDITA